MRKIALILLLAALPLTAQSPAPSGFGFYPVADVSQCVPLPGAVITECVTTNKGAYYNSIQAPTVFTQPTGVGVPGPQGPMGPTGPQGPAGPAFSGGTCHWSPTGAVDAQGVVVKISCP